MFGLEVHSEFKNIIRIVLEHFFGFQAIAGIRGTQTTVLSVPANVTPLARKVVGYWLLGCSGMVFGAVILGNFNIF